MQKGIKLNEYQFNSDYRAAKCNLRKGEKPVFNEFFSGQKVVGYLYDKSQSKEPIPDVVIVMFGKDLWQVRKDVLTTLGPVKEDESSKYDKRYIGGAAFAETYSFKNKNLVQDIVEKSKASTKGAVYGLVLGVVLAFIYKRSVLPFAMVGAVSGGFIGNALGTKKEKSKTE